MKAPNVTADRMADDAKRGAMEAAETKAGMPPGTGDMILLSALSGYADALDLVQEVRKQTGQKAVEIVLDVVLGALREELQDRLDRARLTAVDLREFRA